MEGSARDLCLRRLCLLPDAPSLLERCFLRLLGSSGSGDAWTGQQDILNLQLRACKLYLLLLHGLPDFVNVVNQIDFRPDPPYLACLMHRYNEH